MRGCGQTGAPHDIELYTINHLIGDVVGVVNGLGYEEAIVMGHDWGAPVACISSRTQAIGFNRSAPGSATISSWDFLRHSTEPGSFYRSATTKQS